MFYGNILSLFLSFTRAMRRPQGPDLSNLAPLCFAESSARKPVTLSPSLSRAQEVLSDVMRVL